MPVIMFTMGEVVEVALQAARLHSARILELSDLIKTPLAPGESPDARRHEIAKLGKKLAEAFIAVDETMKALADTYAQQHGNDVTAAGGPHEPDKENTN